jgi:hypothetical protein
MFLLSLLLSAIVGCGSPSNEAAPAAKSPGKSSGNVAVSNEEKEKAEPAALAIVPVFDADSAYMFIEKQLAFGPRVPNSKGHRECGDWLEAKMREYGADVTVQNADITAYNGDVLHARNIIASFMPENKERVLLCAHWDTRPWADSDPDSTNHYKPYPGANDGGSGVGILLEVARQLAATPAGVGIDIIFFDAEDYGRHNNDWRDAKPYEETWALGSKYWAETPHVRGYRARYGILLDIVGAPGSKFRLEGYSMYFAEHIVRMVWAKAHKAGYGKYFLFEDGGAITDDHYYVNTVMRIPCIDIINSDPGSDNGFGPYHHTMKDDMDWISASTLKAVGQTVLDVIYNEK